MVRDDTLSMPAINACYFSFRKSLWGNMASKPNPIRDFKGQAIMTVEESAMVVKRLLTEQQHSKHCH